jgi:hypothetical protein
MRKGYVKKNGTMVKSNCIVSTSESGGKRSVTEKRMMRKLSREHSRARQRFGTPKCKKGEILREGYHRKSYTKKTGSKVKDTWIKPECIRSTTGRSHGKQLFILEHNDLKPFGYQNVEKMTKTERHRALMKALKKYKPLPLARKLNALSVLNKNRNSKLSKIFKEDFYFVESTDKYKERRTSRK